MNWQVPLLHWSTKLSGTLAAQPPIASSIGNPNNNWTIDWRNWLLSIETIASTLPSRDLADITLALVDKALPELACSITDHYIALADWDPTATSIDWPDCFRYERLCRSCLETALAFQPSTGDFLSKYAFAC
jgi:hypothetical protein